MEENKELENVVETETEVSEEVESVVETETLDVEDSEIPLDKNVKLMSPTRMVIRRFFRSKLSIAGLIMLAALFIFCWVGPVVYNQWGEIETDRTGNISYVQDVVQTEDGGEFIQIIVTNNGINSLAEPSSDHILGTDEQGMDIFTRLMYGGRLSLTISFLAVFVTSALGIILGGIAGYYGGFVDNIIMRIILSCVYAIF